VRVAATLRGQNRRPSLRERPHTSWHRARRRAAWAAPPCGAGHKDAAQRSLESLTFAGDAVITNTTEFCRIVAEGSRR